MSKCVVNMRCKNGIQRKLSCIILILSIIVPTIIFYGSIDDFLFQHAGVMQENSNTGHVSEIEPVLANTYSGLSGFYATGIIVSKVCNIPCDMLFFLPLYLISFVFLFYSLLNKFSSDNVLCSLIIFILTTFSSNISFLNFHPHGMGLSLLLVISLLLIIMRRSNKLLSSSSLVIILVLIAINYISYKADAWALMLLFNFMIFDMYNKRFLKSDKTKINNRLLNLVLIGFIVTFTFNKFLYNQFMVSMNSEYDIGINVLLTLFSKNPADLLSYYDLYYISPTVLKYLLISRPFLILCFVSLLIAKIFQNKLLHRIKLDTDELLFISLAFMGVANLFIYNSLGLFDVKILVYTGILSFPTLQRKYKMKKLVNIFIVLLVVINLCYLSVANYYNDAQKDENYFNYIGPVDKWYALYQGNDSELKTDVLTKGYIIKEMTKRGELNYPTHFNVDDMLFITNKSVSRTVRDHKYYVLNYKLTHFSITNWKILKSFSNFRNEIESNKHLEKIYSSSEYVFVYMPVN